MAARLWPRRPGLKENLIPPSLNALRDIVRDEVARSLDTGDGRPQQLARYIRDRYADMVEELGPRLVDKACDRKL